MGAYGGNTYLGNTRTLFEFLSKHSNYRVVWIAKSKILVKELKKIRLSYKRDKMDKNGSSSLFIIFYIKNAPNYSYRQPVYHIM